MIPQEAQTEPIHLDWEMVPGVWLKQDPNDKGEHVEIALPQEKLDAMLFGCRDQFYAIIAELDSDAVANVAARNDLTPGAVMAMLPGIMDEFQSRIAKMLVLRALIDEHLSTSDKQAPFLQVIDDAIDLAKQGRLRLQPAG
jgi:hypothetical protein